MPVVSIIWGVLLIALGLWGRFLTEGSSNTALIPAGIGGLLLICGLAALREAWLKHAMHLAAVVGVLGLVGGLANLGRVLLDSSKSLENPRTFHAVLSTSILIGLCAIFVGLCVNSFIQARRRRAQAGGTSGSGTARA
jgi:hypothetical protein